MRKASFEKNHDEFENDIKWYGQLLRKVVEAERVIPYVEEKREIAGALILRCYTMWEILVEEDIIISLNRDSSAYAGSLGLNLRKHLPRDVCEAMLTGHRYIAFNSVGDIKNFARRYLVPDFNPFEVIKVSVRRKIDELRIIRNYMVHYSNIAWRSYRRMMEKQYKYVKVPDPEFFLMSTHPRTKDYRWADYIENFLECSREMRTAVS